MVVINGKVKFNFKTVLQNLPNKACTGRWGTVRLFEHFSGFEFFLVSNRVHAHPHAGNANRWATRLANRGLVQQYQIFPNKSQRRQI
jgi:hypothetical protein